MSTLDQAFIRAFRAERGRTAAGPSVAEPPPDPPVEPGQPADRVFDVSSPQPQPPAPHWDVGALFRSQVAVVGAFDEPPACDPPPHEEPTVRESQPASQAEAPATEEPIVAAAPQPRRLPPVVRPLRAPVTEKDDREAAASPSPPPALTPSTPTPSAGTSADLAPPLPATEPWLPEPEPPLPTDPSPPDIPLGWTVGKGFRSIDPAERPQPAPEAPPEARPVGADGASAGPPSPPVASNQPAPQPPGPVDAAASPAESGIPAAASATDLPAQLATGLPASFRPLLQVDRFAWPKVCQRLAQAAAAELDALAEELAAACDRGTRAIGVAGCCAGDGTSTTLLCAARQLIARGRKVAIVDINLADPQLARRLGLLPEIGLEDLLAGRQPLEEIAIESVAETAVLAPLRDARSDPLDEAAARRLSEAVDALAGAYDLVLIDLGSLGDGAVADGSLVRALGSCPAAVVLVQHERTAAEAALLEAQRMVEGSGGQLLGLVTNFRCGQPA